MTEEMKKIIERLDDHERRISKLECEIYESTPKENVKNGKKYEGLSGGIRYLLDNDFFENPKSIKEIREELKREGYHYPDSSISKMISVDFTKKTKILNRIKEDNVYKYVIRK